MAVARKLIAAMRRGLQSHANARNAAKGQAYIKSAMPLYGVDTRTRRNICKSVFKAYPLSDFENWRDTVLAMWRGAKHREEYLCAIQLCEMPAYGHFQTLEVLPLYEEMIVTGAWWDLVDPVAAHLIAGLLSRYPRKMKPVLKQWARGRDIWKRRAAILSQLRFKDRTDLDLLYQCIEPSVGSSEFFLQKAIGWALRDYAWTDFREIERYVKSNKSRLSQISRREALKNRSKSVSCPE